jgi:hypothetical protein
VQGDIVRMWGMYADEDLRQIATTEDEADAEDANMLAERIARTLMDRVDGDS